jgi:hypothetical protein
MAISGIPRPRQGSGQVDDVGGRFLVRQYQYEKRSSFIRLLPIPVMSEAVS